MTIHWKAVEQYFTVLVFNFTMHIVILVFNFTIWQFGNFGLDTVRSERVSDWPESTPLLLINCGVS